MTIAKITNHTQQALDRLVSQFKGKQRLEGLITAFTEGHQNLEDVACDFLNFRSVFTAIGAQLDIWGVIVGEERQGKDDRAYRRSIFGKIGINTSEGTSEDVISTFSFLTEAVRVFMVETFPAEMEVYADTNFEFTLLGDGPDAFAFEGGIDGLGFGDIFDTDVGGTFASLQLNDIIELYIIMDRIIGGGIRLNYLGWFNGDQAFSFDGDPDSLGFGDLLDSTVGGDFATIVEPHFPFSFDSDSARTRGFGDTDDIIVGGEFA